MDVGSDVGSDVGFLALEELKIYAGGRVGYVWRSDVEVGSHPRQVVLEVGSLTPDVGSDVGSDVGFLASAGGAKK